VWAAIYGPFNLSCVVPGIFRGAVNPYLATVLIGLGAKKASPVAHFPPSPVTV
jgi:hypothetical protein